MFFCVYPSEDSIWKPNGICSQVGEHAVILGLCWPEVEPGLGNIVFSWVYATEFSMCKTEVTLEHTVLPVYLSKVIQG